MEVIYRDIPIHLDRYNRMMQLNLDYDWWGKDSVEYWRRSMCQYNEIYHHLRHYWSWKYDWRMVWYNAMVRREEFEPSKYSYDV